VTVSTGPVASVEPAREVRVGPGVPVRVVLLHARDPRAREATRRVALAAAGDVGGAIAADDARSFADLAQELRDARPDVAIARPGPSSRDDLAALAEALRFGCASQRPPPRLFVLGDARAAVPIAAAASPLATAAFATETALVAALRALRRRDDDGLRLRDEESEAAARNIAALANADTLVVLVDGATTSCVLARPGGAVDAAHAFALGIGAGADRVVAGGGLDRVRRWLPWPIDTPALLERVFNRARWPDAVPAAPAAVALEMALAREAIAHTLRDAGAAGLDVAAMRRARVIALGGRLASFPRAAQALLVAVDAIEPSAFSTVIRERAGTYETVAAVAPLWPGRSATLHLRHPGGDRDERVSRGAFFLSPVRGRVELTADGAALRGTAEAGALGMLVDARGRPLALPPRDAERLPTLVRWHAAVAALPV